MSSSKLFLFSKEVHFYLGVRLLLELYCAVVLKHIAFTILAKLTVVFTCISLSLNLYASVFSCVCGFGFEQKFWRIDGFGEKKRHGSADLHTPIHPPPPCCLQSYVLLVVVNLYIICVSYILPDVSNPGLAGLFKSQLTLTQD